MSLESNIADLVTATNGLIATFNSKRSEIDKAVSAAIAAVPEMKRTWYVNQISGLDTNAGTATAPFKTIDKAIAATPVSGIADIRLLADYSLDADITVEGRYLKLRGDGNENKKIVCKYYKTVSNSVEATWMTGFVLSGGATVEPMYVEIVLPSSAGVTPAPSMHASVFRAIQGGSNPIVAVKLSLCTVTAPADFIGWIIGASASAAVFQVTSVTFPASFGGHYVYGVASGTNPATLTNVLTNLSTL